MFGEAVYTSPVLSRALRAVDIDKDNKKSPYFIRQKIEIGILAQRLSNKDVKNVFMIIIVIYMYGAICLKYVSGAESFVAGVNHTFWPDDEDGFSNYIDGRDPYYIGLFIFFFFSTYFSFGNIENATTLMIVSTVIRFVAIFLMCLGSIFYIFSNGFHPSPVFDFEN